MKPARTLDIATLRTLIALQQNEEKNLHAILTNTLSSQVRLRALFDLERVAGRSKPHQTSWRNLRQNYSPTCLEGIFTAAAYARRPPITVR
jgi:hypothetical protein